jgi:hypothetical protein
MLAGTSAFWLNACSSDKNTSETQDSTATTEDTLATANKPTEEAPVSTPLLGNLPKTSEVPAMLQLTGADFNSSLINSPAKASDYTTTTDKAALNLGAYATDIGYLCVYGKTQDVITYLKSSEKLASHLGLSDAFGTGAQKRFESNLSNKDSLTKIVDETMTYVKTSLNQGERNQTAALLMTGSFIEGLFISTGLIEKYPKDVPQDVRNRVLTQLIISIAKQQKSIDDLITILKSVESNPQVEAHIASLTDLKKQFTDVDLDEKIKNNKGNLQITDQTLKGITAKVKEIRSQIVS